jgi:enoyl-CoA hydratase/carnithine racemase
MRSVEQSVTNGVATLTLARGKVNAVSPDLVEALERRLDEVEADDRIGAVLLTGRGSWYAPATREALKKIVIR